MTLREYLLAIGQKEAEKVAADCGTSLAYLRQLAGNHRRCGEALAVEIEKATRGAVRVESLRPDIDWVYLARRKTA